MFQQPVRLYTAVTGVFSLLLGTASLAFRFFPTLDHTFPPLLIIPHMIPIHSTLHVVAGILALGILYRGAERGAFLFASGFGLFYVGLGLAGMLSGRQLGLGLQPFDHPVHVALGALGLLAAGPTAYHSVASRA